MFWKEKENADFKRKYKTTWTITVQIPLIWQYTNVMMMLKNYERERNSLYHIDIFVSSIRQCAHFSVPRACPTEDTWGKEPGERAYYHHYLISRLAHHTRAHTHTNTNTHTHTHTLLYSIPNVDWSESMGFDSETYTILCTDGVHRILVNRSVWRQTE